MMSGDIWSHGTGWYEQVIEADDQRFALGIVSLNGNAHALDLIVVDRSALILAHVLGWFSYVMMFSW